MIDMNNERKFHKAEERVEDIMRQLDFVEFREALRNVEDLYDLYWCHCHLFPDNIRFASGATKVVIWDDNHPDFVIKINNDGIDYCEKEAIYYQEARDRGIEDCFAWCDYITTYEGVDIFAMEYCVCDEDYVSYLSYEYRYEQFCDDLGYSRDESDSRAEFEESDMSWDYDNSDAIIELVMGKFFIDDIARKFWKFINEFHINDLHAGNVSINNGRAVFVDFSGF